jgi:hypothetical protein
VRELSCKLPTRWSNKGYLNQFGNSSKPLFQEDAQFKDLGSKLNGEADRCRADFEETRRALEQAKQNVPAVVKPSFSGK